MGAVKVEEEEEEKKTKSTAKKKKPATTKKKTTTTTIKKKKAPAKRKAPAKATMHTGGKRKKHKILKFCTYLQFIHCSASASCSSFNCSTNLR